MNAPLAYLNGRFLPFHEAALSLHDAGFVFGATVVDNARTYSRKLFRWADHLARFRRDCGACGIPLDASDTELTEAAETLIQANSAHGELQVVTFATPGPLGFYVGGPNGPATLGLVTYPVPVERYRHLVAEGVTLVAVPGIVPLPGSVVPPTVKHRSRMNWFVADQAARRIAGLPHALAVNLDGDSLTETSLANLIAVMDGAIVSPPPDRVLNGISLSVTREICSDLKLAFREEPIRIDAPQRISGLLLVGTGFGIAGVRTVHLPDGSRRDFDPHGPVLRTLQLAWSRLTGETPG